MTLDTQKTIALLQELLLALRDNDSNAFKAWLCSGHGSSVSPNSTLPATEQWVGELWVQKQIHALVAVDTDGFASVRSL